MKLTNIQLKKLFKKIDICFAIRQRHRPHSAGPPAGRRRPSLRRHPRTADGGRHQRRRQRRLQRRRRLSRQQRPQRLRRAPRVLDKAIVRDGQRYMSRLAFC